MTTLVASRQRILIVDAVELNRLMAAAVLGQVYDVDTADDVEGALRALALADYDLVLIDADDRSADGFDTAATLRRAIAPDRSKTLLVALSVEAEPDGAERARSRGLDGHIGRPIGPLDLKRRVGQLLDTRSAMRTPQTWQRDRYTDIRNRLGAVRAQGFLVMLLGKFAEAENVLALSTRDGPGLERRIHDLVSVAGMLGFDEMIAVCRSLQGTFVSGTPDVSGLSRALHRASIAIRAELSPIQ